MNFCVIVSFSKSKSVSSVIVSSYFSITLRIVIFPLAISELIARATRQNQFEGTLDLAALVADLPKTPMVGENSGTRMQMFNGKPYIQLDDGDWMVYPGY